MGEVDPKTVHNGVLPGVQTRDGGGRGRDRVLDSRKGTRSRVGDGRKGYQIECGTGLSRELYYLTWDSRFEFRRVTKGCRRSFFRVDGGDPVWRGGGGGRRYVRDPALSKVTSSWTCSPSRDIYQLPTRLLTSSGVT